METRYFRSDAKLPGRSSPRKGGSNSLKPIRTSTSVLEEVIERGKRGPCSPTFNSNKVGPYRPGTALNLSCRSILSEWVGEWVVVLVGTNITILLPLRLEVVEQGGIGSTFLLLDSPTSCPFRLCPLTWRNWVHLGCLGRNISLLLHLWTKYEEHKHTPHMKAVPKTINIYCSVRCEIFECNQTFSYLSKKASRATLTSQIVEKFVRWLLASNLEISIADWINCFSRQWIPNQVGQHFVLLLLNLAPLSRSIL